MKQKNEVLPIDKNTKLVLSRHNDEVYITGFLVQSFELVLEDLQNLGFP